MFAQPLLDTAPEDVEPATVQRVLALAASVWNAMVVDEAEGGGANLAQVLERAGGEDSGTASVIEILAERRRTGFKQLRFLFGSVKVRDDGEAGFRIAVTCSHVQS
jgi:hypothetical protein